MGHAKSISHPKPPAPRMQPHAAPARHPGPSAPPPRNIDPAIKAALSQQSPAIRSGVNEVARQKGTP
jgi:hypothetical protein